jgi:hypothetical protein
MSTNPWLAVDVTTSPKTSACRAITDTHDGELRRAAGRRRRVLATISRRRLNPTGRRAPTLRGDRDEVAERWEAHLLEVPRRSSVNGWIGADDENTTWRCRRPPQRGGNAGRARQPPMR